MSRDKVLVTGSSGHLGEALVRVLRERGAATVGLDRKPGPFTDAVGDIAARPVVRDALADGATAVLHAATLRPRTCASWRTPSTGRVDIADVADAHLLAMAHAPQIGFARYIISATTPFTPQDMSLARRDLARLVLSKFPDLDAIYARLGWRMFPRLDRVYVNARARAELGWTPRHDFRSVLDALAREEDPRSLLARTVGAKGYHDQPTGVYTA